MNKKEVRKEIIKLLQSFTPVSLKEKAGKIHDQLFSTQQWNEAGVIGITVSKGREVDTYSIIERAWKENKTVVVPRCDRETSELNFRKLTSFKQLEETFFGLKEPMESVTEKWSGGIDLLLVPGVAFSSKGERIGYGGGYYDRYLHRYNGQTISICFEIQIIEYIETELHDKKIEMLISENNIYKC